MIFRPDYKYASTMIVDDSEMDLLVNQIILKTNNIAENIVVEQSGLSALNYLEELKKEGQNPPELIFLDLNMPLMNGFEFLEKFERFPESFKNATHIIVITSSDDFLDMEKVIKYKFVSRYLLKPLEISEIRNL